MPLLPPHQAALELGLSPHQLLLLEQYVEGLKHGTIEEARLVDQLTQRVRGGPWRTKQWERLRPALTLFENLRLPPRSASPIPPCLPHHACLSPAACPCSPSNPLLLLRLSHSP